MIADMPSVLWSTAGGRISAEARTSLRASEGHKESTRPLTAVGVRSPVRAALSVTVVDQVQESPAWARSLFLWRSWIVVNLHFRFAG